jgi:hypothetical protein
LILLFGGEVILDVESLANLIRGFAFDHIRDRFTANIKEGLDIKEIGSLTR